ncbi:MAG: hypothetical protein GX040_06190, partial [Alcaligenaceae bacterium]|nr:hypothetical protein [Alcaligenaceae bacterium]
CQVFRNHPGASFEAAKCSATTPSGFACHPSAEGNLPSSWKRLCYTFPSCGGVAQSAGVVAEHLAVLNKAPAGVVA